MTLDKKTAWILFIIDKGTSNGNYLSQEELYSISKWKLRLKNIVEMFDKLKELEKDKFITKEHQNLTEIYKSTKEGQKILGQYIRSLPNGEFNDFVNSLPPEIGLVYRISNLEFSSLWGLLTLSFYELSMLLIKFHRPLGSLFCLFLTAFFFSLTMIFFSRVISFPLQKILNVFAITMKNNKKILTVFVTGLLLLAGGFYFYKEYNHDFWVFLLGVVLAWLATRFWNNISEFFKKS